MSTQPNAAAPFIPPELRDVLQAFRREIFSSLRCAMPGIIQTFDPVTQTATIQVAMQMTVWDQVKDYPPLVDCPVVVLGGGPAFISFPINTGDTCLVLFSDRAIDNWYSTGNVVPPAQQRQHSLADGIALVGIRHLANALSNYDATGIGLNGPAVNVSGNLNVAAGATDVFTTSDGATVTVINGIVVNIDRS